MANLFTAGGWNKDVCVWDVNASGIQAKAKISLTHPVLSTCWMNDGSAVFASGCDSKVTMWNLASNKTVTVGQHAAPIKSCHYIPEVQMLVTGSWDKTIKYWDLRQQNPVATVQLNERCYAMDVKGMVLVVATATVPEQVVAGGVSRTEKKNKVLVYNLADPQKPFRTVESPLKYQHRCISIFPDMTGFAVGSIEGRVAISHIQDHDLGKNFAFKCHRENNDIYAVNSISFHPGFGTFATAGADGIYTFWDKDAKQRLKQFSKMNNPITASAFSVANVAGGMPAGSLYAYAVGYDWSKGVEHFDKSKPSAIYIHHAKDEEIKKKAVR